MRRYAAARPLTERLRVAAYARVSTDDEEQQTSYEAQVDYYTKKIRENPEWIFVEVYADEGITGTSTKRRKNFNRMIDDAMAGMIDRIITKSVSRFARNTVDTLTTVRKLKEKGVGVTFEKENIDTLDSKGELFITIMSSLAQEESRSISENVTWGWRKRIADGKVSVAYAHFLGYEKGPDGKMQIVEEEAKVVREIYAMFLDGKTPSGIAAALTKRSVPTPAGKATWQASTVKSILSNEKYRGDALLQKTFTVDFLTKKAKVNEAKRPNTTSKTATRLSSARRCSSLSKLNWQSAGSGAGARARSRPSPGDSSVGNAAHTSAARSGTARTLTGVSSTAATGSTKRRERLPISSRKGRGTQDSL